MTSYNKADLANGLIGAAVTTSATSITLQTGYGAIMPAAPFKATLSPFGQLPSLGNSEIILVTAVSGDTLTATRAQDGTTAKSFANGDIIGNGIYTTDVPIISGTGANVLKDNGTYGLVRAPNLDFASLTSNKDMQAGWGYFQGTEVTAMSITFSFPVAMSAVPKAFIVSHLGYRLTSSGVPTSISQFSTESGNYVVGTAISATQYTISTVARDSSSTVGSDVYIGFSYIAIV